MNEYEKIEKTNQVFASTLKLPFTIYLVLEK